MPSPPTQLSYLDVVTTQYCYLSIHDHVLGMECTEYRPVVVDDLQIDVRNLVRVRKFDILDECQFSRMLSNAIEKPTWPVYSFSETG